MPRHELVPVAYEQGPSTGAGLSRNATDPAWQDGIYANRGLFTKVGEGSGSWGTAVVGLSSTSTPGLMTRMLETLNIHEGHDVLEIGTGTGYNAALLTHRLGAEHVFSVDIDRELVDLARDRLALGSRPHSAVARRRRHQTTMARTRPARVGPFRSHRQHQTAVDLARFPEW